MPRFTLTALAFSLALLAAGAACAQAASAPAAAASSADDPYLWLEKVDDAKAMDWCAARTPRR